MMLQGTLVRWVLKFNNSVTWDELFYLDAFKCLFFYIYIFLYNGKHNLCNYVCRFWFRSVSQVVRSFPVPEGCLPALLSALVRPRQGRRGKGRRQRRATAQELLSLSAGSDFVAQLADGLPQHTNQSRPPGKAKKGDAILL